MGDKIKSRLITRTVLLIICLIIIFLIFSFYALAFVGLSMFTGGANLDDVFLLFFLVFLVISIAPIALIISAWKRYNEGEPEKAGTRSAVALGIGGVPAIALIVILYLTIFRQGPVGDYPIKPPDEYELEALLEDNKWEENSSEDK